MGGGTSTPSEDTSGSPGADVRRGLTVRDRMSRQAQGCSERADRAPATNLQRSVNRASASAEAPAAFGTQRRCPAWEAASVTATSGEAVEGLSLTTGPPPGAGRSRRLVGRDRELAEVAETITSSSLTTVTGPGGVGKTALAVAVAAASSAHFRDGVFVVWLASLRSADLVAGEVAAQVGMQRSGGHSNEEALACWLADRDVLLVLDNCEHVVSAVAEVVEDLTARLPRLHVLATSREPLWVVDEVNYRLAPLPAAEAVRLFQERAGARAQASLDGDRAGELVGEICRRVDGLPLRDRAPRRPRRLRYGARLRSAPSRLDRSTAEAVAGSWS